VDFSTLFKNMFNANDEFHKKTTLCFFAKAHEYKCNHINKRCNGAPTIGELTQVDGLITSKKKFVGCENWKAGDKNHRFLTIPNNIDLELLETMFNENYYHSHNIK